MCKICKFLRTIWRKCLVSSLLCYLPGLNKSMQRIFNNCERELEWLDMRINVKKAHCLRIGPRFNISYVYE